MDINTAKSSFQNILNSLSNKDRSLFLEWCEENFTGYILVWLSFLMYGDLNTLAIDSYGIESEF